MNEYIRTWEIGDSRYNMIVAFKLSYRIRIRMQMTPEGTLQGGKFGSKSGRMIGRAASGMYWLWEC